MVTSGGPTPAPSLHGRAWLLALLCPLLVLGLGFAVLSSDRITSPKATGFDRRLAVAEPEALVLGGSLARTDVHVEVLGEETGIGRKNIEVLMLPNATAPHWYAILKNRVYANGHAPRLVFIVGAMTTMITPDILMDSNVERLMEQLTDDEPVIAAKVLHTDSPAWFSFLFMRERAATLRNALLSRYRTVMLSRMFAANGRLADGEKLAERTNEIVFADEKMQYELHQENPTGMYDGAVEEIALRELDVEAESLIPDIADMVVAGGGVPVFVRTPFPPSNSDNDVVPPEIEAAAIASMERHGGIWLDMTWLNLEEMHFQDMRHMNREGAAIFTRAVVQALKERGIVDGDAAGPAASAEVVVEGQAPTWTGTAAGEVCRVRVDIPWVGEGDVDLPLVVAVGGVEVAPVAALSGCEPGWVVGDGHLLVAAADVASVQVNGKVKADHHGAEAWTLFPGTKLALAVDQGWLADPHSFQVYVVGRAWGEGLARLTIGAESTPLQRRGHRQFAVWSPAPPPGPWTIELSSPPDGPVLLVHNVAVGRAPDTRHLLGRATTMAGASLRLVGGRMEDLGLTPVFRAPPPAVAVDVEVRRPSEGVGSFALPNLSALADAETPRVMHPHVCSPLRVVEDGVMLPLPHQSCHDVVGLGAGRSCHAGNVMYFASSDGSLPGLNGKAYGVVLDPTRVCERVNQKDTTPLRDALWLYPRDELELVLPPEGLAQFQEGANRLELGWTAPVYGPADRLRVELVVDGQPWAAFDLEPTEDRRRARAFNLDPPLPTTAHDVRLRVRNDQPASWWLLLTATLSETWIRGFGTEEIGVGDPLAPVRERDPLDARLANGVKVSRVGTLPVVPAPRGMAALREGLIEVYIQPLWAISSSVLENKGYGPWTPLVVWENGVRLHNTNKPKELRQGCEECFLHQGKAIVVRPKDVTGAGLTFGLEPDAPMVSSGGSQVYWVYPGTALRFDLPQGWAGPKVTVRAVADVFSADKQAETVVPMLRAFGYEAPFTREDRGLLASVTVAEGHEGPWVVEVDAPARDVFVLLLGLEVLDDSGVTALVQAPRVLGEAADPEGLPTLPRARMEDL